MIGTRCTFVNTSGMTTKAASRLVPKGRNGRFDFYVAVNRRIIEDLAGDWRRLDERIESLSA
jgi:hypothetical protein